VIKNLGLLKSNRGAKVGNPPAFNRLCTIGGARRVRHGV